METYDILQAIDGGIDLWWRTIGSAGGFAHHTGDIEWVESCGHAGPERIFHVRLSPETAAERIGEIAAGMRSGILPGGMLLTPLSTPGNIVELLVRQGFHIDDSSPCMALELGGFLGFPPDPRIGIDRVEGRDALQAWAGIVNAGLFGRELFSLRQYEDMLRLGNTSLYLASYAGVPASACMTIRGGAIATLECVATLPEYRRRGLASAAVCHALERLRELGIGIATLRAELDGVSLYKRLGFVEYCKRIVASIGE